jgi:D-3-phosphoglycerate dehydrogenase
MDNIDVEYAINQGLHVINTPEASSQSVAELVFAHLYGMVRFLHQSNREMPLEGDTRFKTLKKTYGNGIELQGKTIGIIGFGRIGQTVAKIAIGLGMKVVAYDAYVENAIIELSFFDGRKLTFDIEVQPLDEVLSTSDFITVHVPAQENYILGKTEFDKMKDGTYVINAARGGVMDEIALVNAMEEGKIQCAGLDVFEKEPSPEIQLLMNPNLSLSPHIGAATNEAQERIGEELATQIIRLLKEE